MAFIVLVLRSRPRYRDGQRFEDEHEADDEDENNWLE
jgi:hypothetical protein